MLIHQFSPLSAQADSLTGEQLGLEVPDYSAAS
jgi:hypothetical protein